MSGTREDEERLVQRKRPPPDSLKVRDAQDDTEEEDNDPMENALLKAALEIGTVLGYIRRTGLWIWALLIFAAVLVLFIFHFIASSTVPWVAPVNFFRQFSLAAVMPLWLLLPLGMVQTIIRDAKSVYFPLYGIIVFGCFVLAVIEFIAVIIQTADNFSPIATIITNLDILSAASIIACLIGMVVIIIAYVPLIYFEARRRPPSIAHARAGARARRLRRCRPTKRRHAASARAAARADARVISGRAAGPGSQRRAARPIPM